MSDLYAVWTLYTRPDGKVVRHVFGPYQTRAKAQTCVRELERNADRASIPPDRHEAYVTKMIPAGRKGEQ